MNVLQSTVPEKQAFHWCSLGVLEPMVNTAGCFQTDSGIIPRLSSKMTV
jgi:hypothetical protein